MKRDKITRWVIYIIGALCLYIFISLRYQPMYNSLLREKVTYWDNTKYGELYYFSMIRHFREKDLPPFSRKFEHSEKQASLKDAEILTFGDSFFEFSRIRQFPEHIADDFRKKVHYVNYDFPLQYLADSNYTDTIPKLVIFERVERYIPVTFSKEHTVNKVEPVRKTRAGAMLKSTEELLFYKKSEQLLDVMLKRSYLTTGIYSFIATLKFDLFDYISDKTPVYKVDGDNSWLFYHDQVNKERTSFYYQFTDEQIDSICNNMASLAKQLKEKYNMTLVYLPMPARYTLCHTVINRDPYNNFLPRLYEQLDAREIKYIKIFDDYVNADDCLYFKTDEHWNQKGFDLAYGKAVNYIRDNPDLQSFLNPGLAKSQISQELSSQ